MPDLPSPCRPLLAATLLALAGAAQATDPNLCSAQQFQECLNGVSSAVTSFDALRVRPPAVERRHDEEKKGALRAQSAPIILAANGNVSGVIAADQGSGWAAWLNARRADFAGKVAIAPYRADADTYSLGVDKLIGQRLSLGLALSEERIDTRTLYNGGGQRLDGPTLLAYGAYLVNDRISVDFNAGHGRLDSRQERIDPANGSTLRASHDARRRFIGANLNVSYPQGAWTLGSRAGLLDARDTQDGYTESGGPSARTVGQRNIKLRQLSLAGDAAYTLARHWQAYAGVTYRRDLSRDDGASAGGLPGAVGNTQPSDRSEFEWVLGVRAFALRGFTGSLEYVKTTGRDQFEHDAVSLLGRYEF